MTRVTESQLLRSNVHYINLHREEIDKLNREIDSGLKVANPSDSSLSATISQYRESLTKLDSYKNRAASVKSFLTFQDDALSQVGDLINRAKEIAAQAANETNSPATRAQMAEEVFQIRDHLASLANSKYQGKFVWGGAVDDDPPYDAQSYGTPATGGASVNYVWDGAAGRSVSKTVNVSENLTVSMNVPGNQIFDNAIQGLESLGRSLAGYITAPNTGAPGAYTFPQDFALQTSHIQDALDTLETARTADIETERVSIGGKLRRIETAESLLQLSKSNAEDVLDKLQNADIAESASALTQAQTYLQASLTVTGRVLNQSILDFI